MQRRATAGSLGGLILLILSAGCAARRPIVPVPPPSAARPIPPTPVPGGGAGDAVAGTALGFRGVPYRFGGADPGGFDCSGFVQYVYAQHGVALPRIVREQFDFGRQIGDAEVRPGDLLFFQTKGDGVSHVGIAVGGDAFVHAPNSRGSVRVDRLSSTYWGERYIGARRIAGQL
jgi:peptidoglycan DL-endopeptidase CwlO